MANNDTYEIYAQDDADLKVVDANEGALIYVGTTTKILKTLQLVHQGQQTLDI